MGNDMSWEQKCRISALRAACASSFESYGLELDEQIAKDHQLGDPDEVMTTRILARAETFRVALLSDGALDYVPDDDETPESNVCPGCGSSNRLVRKAVVDSPSAPTLYCEHKWHQL